MSNIQQTYNLLQQIYDLMNQIENKTVTTEDKLYKTAIQATLVNQLLNKTIGLFRKMGLPPQIDSLVMKAQRLIGIINQVRLAVVALNAAMIGTPGGAFIAGISFLMIVLDVGDLMMS